jgi:hypothetical protein
MTLLASSLLILALVCLFVSVLLHTSGRRIARTRIFGLAAAGLSIAALIPYLV